MKNAVRYLIFLAVFFLLFSTLAVGADEPPQVKEFTATIDKDGVQRVSILGGGYYFDPNYIIVKVNVPVELTVTKESGFVPHDVVIEAPEAGIDFSVELSSTPKTVTFTPTRAGKYQIFCSKKLLFFESHRHKGMEGTLEVRE